MESLKKFGRDTENFFRRLLKREDDVLNKKITFTTRISHETRSITWNIENLISSPLKVGEYHESPQFSTGYQFCTKWTLRVYPRGKKPNGKVGFYLHKESPSVQVNVEVAIKMGDLEDAEENMIPVFEKKSVLMSSERTECGSDVDVPWNKLRDKSMKILCNLNVGYLDELVYSEVHLSDSSSVCMVCDDLKDIYSSGKFSDMKFVVGRKEVPAHKAILAARSEYFAAMFDHPMQESQTNVVSIEDVELPTFNDFLHFIYTGNVENLTFDRAMALYRVADKYVLPELRKLCVRVILSNVCIENVCQVAVLGDQHYDRQLKAIANYTFRKFRHRIFQTKMWKRLVEERPLLASDILREVSTDF